MAYIGAQPNKSLTKTTSQSFNGTGSATAFTLNRAVNTGEELEVFVDNVQQEPGSGKSYTATGTTLTFDEAPPLGTGNVYVIYRGLAEVTTRLEHDANQALSATTGTFTSLNVPTIKDSSGTNTAMTIDSSGRVSRPVIPFAFVGFPGTDSYVAQSANTVVTFSHAFVNDGNHYDTSTYKFTCPIDGLYRVEISTLSELETQAAAWNFVRETGGTATALGRIYTRYRALAGSMTIKCSANDKLYLTQNTNNDYYQTTTVPYNWATYTFIG